MNENREPLPNETEEEGAGRPVGSRRPEPGAGAALGKNSRGFADDFLPFEEGITPFRIVDALLKRPARAVYEISRGDFGRVSLVLFAVAAACAAAYGAIMGSFSGGPQYWVVPAKVVIGTFLSALICLPSLHILTALSGGNQSFRETAAILLLNLALSGILLIGFAPIAWIFSQSTNSASFMGGLHLLFWIVSIRFGLRLMGASLAFLNNRTMGVMTLWSCIFMVVVFQMCTTLRPLVGKFDGYEFQGKMFFLEQWMGHWEQSGGRR